MKKKTGNNRFVVQLVSSVPRHSVNKSLRIPKTFVFLDYFEK